MTIEHTAKTFPNAALEAILDQDCIDSGMTQEELQQAKQIAEIETNLVAAGRPIKEIYAEWAKKTPAQIIAEYTHDCVATHNKMVHLVSQDTNWFPAIFQGLSSEQPHTARLGVNVVEGEDQPVLTVSVADHLLPTLRALKQGQSVNVRLSMVFGEQGPHATLLEIKKASRSDFKLAGSTTGSS